MKALLTLCAAGVLLVPPAAFASTLLPTDPPSTRVQYRTQELTTPEGAQALLQRLRKASDLVCRPIRNEGGGMETIHRFYDCRRGALQQAVASVDAPQLTAALYPHRQPRPVLQAQR